MRAVIVGCGRVGAGLARRLCDAGHEVAVIDRDPAAFRRLADHPGITTVVGMGFDRDHLEQAGILAAEAFAALTNGDNSNIISARIARETYGIERIVARIYDPRRAAVFADLGIPTIATVPWTIDAALGALFPEDGATRWRAPCGGRLVERRPPRSAIGRPVDPHLAAEPARLAGVVRDGRVRLPVPGDIVTGGDRWLLLEIDDEPCDDAVTLGGAAVDEPGAGRP